ncbi:MAG: type 2 periplasmic-binding domain-containing protein [Planctomycetota bacterium]|jgi:hypothetical protein
MLRYRVWPVLLLASLVSARAEEPEATPAPKEKKPERIVLAIIVHPKNPVTNLSFRELRAYLKVERQFWPNRKRCEIYLPSRKTEAYTILLKKIYRMSHKKLQKYWVRRLFSGEIPAKPSFVPSAKAAGSRVLKSEGAVSIVSAKRVPKKVRVLLIDGKKPGDEGYPLSAPVKPKPETKP